MLVGYLSPYTVQAQNRRYGKRADDHYFLNNFKCSVEAGLNSHAGSGKVFDVDYGLCFGYHFFEYDNVQSVIARQSAFTYKNVKLEVGKAFFSVETSIRKPEEYVFKHPAFATTGSFNIHEKFFLIPLVLRWTKSDLYSGGIYVSLFLGYNVKYLLRAHYIPSRRSDLNAEFLDEIPDLKDYIDEINPLTHSVSLGSGFLALWGLYLDSVLDFPLSAPNDSIYLSNICEHPPEYESETKLLRRFRVSICLGLDIVRVIRTFKGIQE